MSRESEEDSYSENKERKKEDMAVRTLYHPPLFLCLVKLLASWQVGRCQWTRKSKNEHDGEIDEENGDGGGRIKRKMGQKWTD